MKIDLWKRQFQAIIRLEMDRTFFSRRGWWIYLLALAPVFLTAAHTIHDSGRASVGHDFQEDYMIYAGIFQFFYLRLGIFFGCMGIFSNLFRGEMMEKTMHYYLLTPVRREVLAVAKYAAGLVVAVTVFGGCVAAAYLLIGMHFGPQWQAHFSEGPGVSHLLQYVGVAALACLGYGAVFLVMGLKFKNPMIPAGVLMVWEAANIFLPAVLKKFSVIFYLQGLCPVTLPISFEREGPAALLAVPAEPPPAWLAIVGLIGVSALVLFYAAKRVQKLEVNYGE